MHTISNGLLHFSKSYTQINYLEKKQLHVPYIAYICNVSLEVRKISMGVGYASRSSSYYPTVSIILEYTLCYAMAHVNINILGIERCARMQ